jgi:hypothetical protein
MSNVGNETSGLNTVVNGFSFGVKVDLFDGKENKTKIFFTGGNNVDQQNRLLGVYKYSSLHLVF